MDLNLLRGAGLTDGEIKVYVSLLELGSSSTGPIINRSRIARSIAYIILEKLMEKGLVSYIMRDKRKYFQAADPNKLLEYIDERDKKLHDNRNRIESLIPELLLKQKMMNKSEAAIYTGLRAIRICHEHTYHKLKKDEEYVYLGIPASQPEEQHLYWMRDHVRRAVAGITCRLLFNNDTDQKTLKQRNTYKGCDARLMPPGITTPANILIYADVTVIILQSPTAIAVEVTNQEIADSFKSYFENFWKKSKPLRK